ncbi:hypothetical protein HDU97_007161 [Phlyctochytrium planicorne]|nr:hypothetical protein HDU97_007161 [Phlyctochytrium planicorne]
MTVMDGGVDEGGMHGHQQIPMSPQRSNSRLFSRPPSSPSHRSSMQIPATRTPTPMHMAHSQSYMGTTSDYGTEGVALSRTPSVPGKQSLKQRSGLFKMRRSSVAGGMLFSDHGRSSSMSQSSMESLKEVDVRTATFTQPVNAGAGSSASEGANPFRKMFMGRPKDADAERKLDGRRTSRNLFVAIPNSAGPTESNRNLFRRTFAGPKTAPAVPNTGDDDADVVDESGFIRPPTASFLAERVVLVPTEHDPLTPVSAAPSTTSSHHPHPLQRRKSFKGFKLPSFMKQPVQLPASELPESKVWSAGDAWKNDNEEAATEEVSEMAAAETDQFDIVIDEDEDLEYPEGDRELSPEALLAALGRSFTSPAPSRLSETGSGLKPARSIDDLYNLYTEAASAIHVSYPTMSNPSLLATPPSVYLAGASRSSSIHSLSSSTHSTLITSHHIPISNPPPLPSNNAFFQSLKSNHSSVSPPPPSTSPPPMAKRQPSSVSLTPSQKGRSPSKFPDFDSVLASGDTTIRISLTPQQYGRVMRHSMSLEAASGSPNRGDVEGGDGSELVNRSRSQSRSSEGTLGSRGTTCSENEDVQKAFLADGMAFSEEAPPVPPIPKVYSSGGVGKV